jgi:hypothetical protein
LGCKPTQIRLFEGRLFKITFALMRLSIRILFFVSFGLFTQCGEEAAVVSVPSTVLPPDSMVSILRDLHLMESGINGHFFQSNQIVADRSILRGLVFEKHKVEASYFLKSMDFYSANPEHLDSVYQQVIVELSKLQSGG